LDLQNWPSLAEGTAAVLFIDIVCFTAWPNASLVVMLTVDPKLCTLLSVY
jgi:hypothetical protein